MAPSQVGVDVSSSASGSAFVPQSRDSGVTSGRATAEPFRLHTTAHHSRANGLRTRFRYLLLNGRSRSRGGGLLRRTGA